MTLVIAKWDKVSQRHIPVRKEIKDSFDVNSNKKEIGEIAAISYYQTLDEIWIWCDPSKAVRP